MNFSLVGAVLFEIKTIVTGLLLPRNAWDWLNLSFPWFPVVISVVDGMRVVDVRVWLILPT